MQPIRLVLYFYSEEVEITLSGSLNISLFEAFYKHISIIKFLIIFMLFTFFVTASEAGFSGEILLKILSPNSLAKRFMAKPISCATTCPRWSIPTM